MQRKKVPAGHHRFGLAGVDVAGRTWTPSSRELATWEGEPTGGTTVVVRFDVRPTPTPTP